VGPFPVSDGSYTLSESVLPVVEVQMMLKGSQRITAAEDEQSLSGFEGSFSLPKGTKLMIV